MNIIELQEDLQNLITDKKINQAFFARALDISTSAVSDRFKSLNKITFEDLDKIEDYLGIKIYATKFDKDFLFCDNSGTRQNDTSVDEKSSQFGKRLSRLQGQHNFLDREMAQLLHISEREYIKLVLGKIKPTLDILNRIKQNFKVSIDELLYG